MLVWHDGSMLTLASWTYLFEWGRWTLYWGNVAVHFSLTPPHGFHVQTLLKRLTIVCRIQGIHKIYKKIALIPFRLVVVTLTHHDAIAQSHYLQMVEGHVGRVRSWISLLNQWQPSIQFDAHWRTLFWRIGGLAGAHPLKHTLHV